MVVIGKLLRFGRRQLHTIISREIIKPANPTPSHLPTYNLSAIDLFADKAYIPLVLFYPNNASCSLTAQDKAKVLKDSLSQSLTKYYHFAGKLPTHTTPYVDCNDEGVAFLEARSDRKLDEIQLSRFQDGDLDHLFADDMVCYNSPRNTNLVGIQLNHFACGGVGVAVSMSHLVGDGCTLGSFVNHWASVARYGSTDHKEVLPLNPHFIHFPRTDSLLPEALDMNQDNAVVRTRDIRKFVFPNSKLSDLKKAIAPATNDVPTRVEALTSLLFKTAVATATTSSGCFSPSCLFITADIRKKFVKKLPQTTAGNFVTMMMVPTYWHEREISLGMLVAEIRKQKVQLEGVESVQQVAEKLKLVQSKMGSEGLEHVGKRFYVTTSLCGFGFNKFDFGWGKPMAVRIPLRSADGMLLMDTPDGDGIEAHVILEHEDMEIFQNDKELLSFCQVN